MKGGGAWRFTVILKQTKALWIASRGSCQESRNQNTTLLGGSGWKKGRCEMGFKLSCFCVCTSWIVLFFTQIILYPQRCCQHCLTERYDLNHSLCLKLASVTLGVTAGKNLSVPTWSHLSHYLFPCRWSHLFLNLLHRFYSLDEQKPWENHHPAWLWNKSLFFFSLVCRRINRKHCVCCCWIVRIGRGHFKHSMFSYRT